VQPALTAIERAVAELGEAHTEPSGLIRMNSSRVAARLLIEPQMGSSWHVIPSCGWSW
jgi:DNA-binding transcriptional LysR family regulator